MVPDTLVTVSEVVVNVAVADVVALPPQVEVILQLYVVFGLRPDNVYGLVTLFTVVHFDAELNLYSRRKLAPDVGPTHLNTALFDDGVATRLFGVKQAARVVNEANEDQAPSVELHTARTDH